jgi:hypothetical protein
MAQDSPIERLASICEELDEDEPAMNKNFYAVNLHGYETKEDFIIPENVRIIMFCYSGRKLNVCPRFDKFNWTKIFTNESAAYNYCTFLANIAQYSSIRDHFCIYNPGDRIKNINFRPDDYFRHGLFALPVHAAVYVREDNRIYTTDSDSTGKTIISRSLSRYTSNVKTDREKACSTLRYSENPAIILSPHIMNANQLSTIVNNLKFKHGGVTLLLLTCREGKPVKLPHTIRVKEELELMYEKYLSAR